MANQTYVWVGGLTSTTSVDRFSWNVAGNWKRREKTTLPWPESGTRYIYHSTNYVPGPGDIALVGVDPGYDPISYGAEYKVHSPLLFGGFTGNVHGGTWSGSNPSPVASNIYGTTFASSLLDLEIGTGERNYNSKPYLTKYLYYPFPIVGGGITYSVIETLKGYNVEGMNSYAWDTILANRTAEQESGLIIKADIIGISTPRDVVRFKPKWNAHRNSTSYAGLGLTGDALWIKIDKIIDNYGYNLSVASSNETTKNNNRWIKTGFGAYSWNTQMHIYNAKIFSMGLNGTPLGTQTEIRYNTQNVTGNEFNFYNITSNNTYINLVGFNNLNFVNCLFSNTRILQYWATVINDLPAGQTYANYTQPINVTLDPYAAYYDIYGRGYTGGVTMSCLFELGIYDNSLGTVYGLPKYSFGSGFTGNHEGTEVQVKVYNWRVETPINMLLPKTQHSRSIPIILEPGMSVAKMSVISDSTSYYYRPYGTQVWGRIVTPETLVSSNLKIGVYEMILQKDSVLDMYNTSPDVWKFGKITGITFSGGIKFDGGRVLGSNSTRLLNYVVNNGINKRTNSPQLIDTNPMLEGYEAR